MGVKDLSKTNSRLFSPAPIQDLSRVNERIQELEQAIKLFQQQSKLAEQQIRKIYQWFEHQGKENPPSDTLKLLTDWQSFLQKAQSDIERCQMELNGLLVQVQQAAEQAGSQRVYSQLFPN